jgi:hypothetical protein
LGIHLQGNASEEEYIPDERRRASNSKEYKGFTGSPRTSQVRLRNGQASSVSLQLSLSIVNVFPSACAVHPESCAQRRSGPAQAPNDLPDGVWGSGDLGPGRGHAVPPFLSPFFPSQACPPTTTRLSLSFGIAASCSLGRTPTRPASELNKPGCVGLGRLSSRVSNWMARTIRCVLARGGRVQKVLIGLRGAGAESGSKGEGNGRVDRRRQLL